MRTLWTGLTAIAVLVLVAAPAAASNSSTPGETCQASLSPSEDEFLRGLAGPSLNPPQPILAAGVICCTPQDCCVFLERETCLAQGGSIYSTALGCNKACRC